MKLLHLLLAVAFAAATLYSLLAAGNVFQRRDLGARLFHGGVACLFLLGTADAFHNAVAP